MIIWKLKVSARNKNNNDDDNFRKKLTCDARILFLNLNLRLQENSVAVQQGIKD